MSDIKSWRRRFGVTAMLLACLFMAGWIRSLGFEDVITFPAGFKSKDSVYSVLGGIYWLRFHASWNAPDAGLTFSPVQGSEVNLILRSSNGSGDGMDSATGNTSESRSDSGPFLMWPSSFH